MHRLPARLAVRVASICCAAVHRGAGAETSPCYLGLAQNYGHESNLLQLTVNQPTPADYNMSDSASSTSLLGGFDQPLGRRRAYTNVSLRNLERFGTVSATTSLGLVAPYTLEVTAGQREVRHSLPDPAVQARECTQDSTSIGQRWRPSSAAVVGIAVAATQGRYPKFRLLADGSDDAERFRRGDVELRGTLQPSGASAVEARPSRSRTRYDLNQQRNFDGLTGSVAWRWQPTGRLRLNTRYTRDTGQDAYATAVFNVPATTDYSRVTGLLRSQRLCDATAKPQFNMAIDVYWPSIVRTTLNPFLRLDASGKERTPILALGARWTPLRYALVGCGWSRERRRTSGQLSEDLNSTSFSCFAQATLQ